MADSRDILEFDPTGQIVIGCKDKSVKEIVIPQGVTEIGEKAFVNYESTNETFESIVLPDGVTKIGNDAFYGCADLVSVRIPDSLTEIGDFAFCNCLDLASIVIPKGVTKIGTNAFGQCDSLKEVHVFWENPEDLKKFRSAFDRLYDCTLYVPEGTAHVYNFHISARFAFKEIVEE